MQAHEPSRQERLLACARSPFAGLRVHAAREAARDPVLARQVIPSLLTDESATVVEEALEALVQQPGCLTSQEFERLTRFAPAVLERARAIVEGPSRSIPTEQARAARPPTPPHPRGAGASAVETASDGVRSPRSRVHPPAPAAGFWIGLPAGIVAGLIVGGWLHPGLAPLPVQSARPALDLEELAALDPARAAATLALARPEQSERATRFARALGHALEAVLEKSDSRSPLEASRQLLGLEPHRRTPRGARLTRGHATPDIAAGIARRAEPSLHAGQDSAADGGADADAGPPVRPWSTRTPRPAVVSQAGGAGPATRLPRMPFERDASDRVALADVFTSLAHRYLEMEESERAAHYASRALAIAPDLPDARAVLASAREAMAR